MSGETSYSILKKRIGNISQTEQIEIIKFLKKIDLLNENILKEKNFSNKFDYKEIPTKKVLLKKIIKTTAFQTTWVGIWNEKNAFIIQLNDSIYLSDRQLYKIRNEISFISSLSHKFLVKTFGGCTQNQEKILIVSEYHSGGNLRERLNKSSIPNDEKYRIILQIAKGIQYLHSMDIIHGSLFTDKILFDCKNNVKISGFGITRHVPPLAWSLILKTQPVPQSPFQAPELFLHPNITSKKIDIFSFAMIIWEIVTRKDVTNSSWWNYMKFKDALLKGKRPEIKVATAYQELIKKCWHQHPESRPSIGQIIQYLKEKETILK
ncbi:palmitoyltransferase [Anaeramoeba flamelloides]|uniref:Palmitoyltransferase n=1 Tax=Anaeramoeba flamelloides TaxID=1746091 RepID=A0AAV7YWX4_9EUKA|nr:palmitoyltransferase [Anaeramoeba flamelloides]